jgi:hypothetical protein
MYLQLFVILLIICISMTIIPLYAYLRGFGGTFTRRYFTSNICGFALLAFIIVFIPFGVFAMLLFLTGSFFLLTFGSYRIYRRRPVSRILSLLLAVLFIVFGGVFVLVMYYWTFFGMLLAVNPDLVLVSAFYETSLLLFIFAAFNFIPFIGMMEMRSKRRVQGMMLAAVLFFIIVFVGVQVLTPLFSANLTQDPFTTFLFETLKQPVIGTAIGFMVFGSVLKTLEEWQANFIGDVLVYFYPMLIWGMVLVGAVPVPDAILTLFEMSKPVARFVFILIQGIIFMIAMSMLTLFSRLASPKIKIF